MIDEDGVETLLAMLAEDLREIIMSKIVGKNLVYTGRMLSNVEIERISSTEYDVVVKVPYASVMEFGAKPHTPPFEKIYNWVVLKKGETWRARDATWAIVKTMQRKGILGRKYVKEAIEEFLGGAD